MRDNIENDTTKKIIFEGQTYEVPVWVRWVARDADGEITGYETQPIERSVQWYVPHSQSSGRNFCIGWATDWEDSLTEV
jgi:hypothetical protein